MKKVPTVPLMRAKKPKNIKSHLSEDKPVEQVSKETQVKPAIESAIQEIPKPRESTSIDNYNLPTTYNTTSITLMARDPYWMHAYWEIAPSSIENIKESIGNDLDKSAYALRMYDVSSIDFNGHNANHWFDIDVTQHTNNWYISVWRDNVAYCADIGIRTPDGRFFTLARSNFVTTPRASPSDRRDVIWMEVKDEPHTRPLVFVEAEAKKKRYRYGAEKISPQKPSRRKILLTEDDIKAYYSKLFPLLSLVSQRQKSGLSSKLLEINLKDGITLDEVILKHLSKGKFVKRLLLGSSEELIVEGGASELVAGGASEREAKKRGFSFEINTELIVYGRTEPNAEVWLSDKKIKLRDDGTFTLRFALTDGKIPLDFVAHSCDKKEKRSISTSVERTKTKQST